MMWLVPFCWKLSLLSRPQDFMVIYIWLQKLWGGCMILVDDGLSVANINLWGSNTSILCPFLQTPKMFVEKEQIPKRVENKSVSQQYISAESIYCVCPFLYTRKTFCTEKLTKRGKRTTTQNITREEPEVKVIKV